MSTKIYNGARLPKIDMQELLKFCKELQKKFEQAKYVGIRSSFAERFIRVLDRESMKSAEKVDFKKIRADTWNRFTDSIMQADMKKQRHPWDDFETSAVFFPMKDKVLAIFYGDNKEMLDIWEKNVEDYHYQDQSDRPEDVDAKGWKARKSDWDEVLLNGNGIPSQNGFTFKFTSNDDIFFAPEWKTVKPYVTPKAKRIQEQLLDLCLQSMNKNNEVQVSAVMRAIDEAKAFIKDRKNSKQINEWKKLINSKLITRLEP